MLYSFIATCKIKKNYDLKGVGTCKVNIIGFVSNLLKIDKKCASGSYTRLVDKRIGMVITRLKDSQIIQVVSTVMKS